MFDAGRTADKVEHYRLAKVVLHARVRRGRAVCLSGRRPMIVKNILSEKGSNVVTIEPTATLAEAAKVLAERRIGAIIITGAGGRITGIVSERDVVRSLAQHGPQALQF